MAATVQSNFVPEIWSARFTSRLDDELVWGSVANRSYEGDIAAAGMEAITLARQIVENEAYRPEARFGDAIKGLMVYGAKVVLGARLFSMEYKSSA